MNLSTASVINTFPCTGAVFKQTFAMCATFELQLARERPHPPIDVDTWHKETRVPKLTARAAGVACRPLTLGATT